MFLRNNIQKHQVLHLPVQGEHHEKMSDNQCFSVLDASVEFGSCSEESGDHLCVFSIPYVSAPESFERFYVVPEAFSREVQHMLNSKGCSED